MDLFEAIKVKALHSVLHPDEEYFTRKLYRWYSKTFFTPLQEVYDLPLESVLRDWYEERFEALEEDERSEELALVLETTDQKTERKSVEEQEKATEEDFAKMAEKANDIKLERPSLEKVVKKLETLTDKIAEMKTDPAELPKDVEIRFENDDAEFEKLLDEPAIPGGE